MKGLKKVGKRIKCLGGGGLKKPRSRLGCSAVGEEKEIVYSWYSW